jgi:hypothetical protein
MSTIMLSKAKKLVGDRDCHIGDFLYMDPIAVPSSLDNVIGIGGTVESAKSDAEIQAANTNVALQRHGYIAPHPQISPENRRWADRCRSATPTI